MVCDYVAAVRRVLHGETGRLINHHHTNTIFCPPTQSPFQVPTSFAFVAGRLEGGLGGLAPLEELVDPERDQADGDCTHDSLATRFSALRCSPETTELS